MRVIDTLRAAFAAHADPSKAGPMQAYMKSALPFYGIPAPLRRQLTVAAAKAHPAPDSAALLAAMRALWRGARHREERYAAIELPRSTAAHRKLMGLEFLPLLEEMLVDGAWWDFCDDISGHALQSLLQRHPAEINPLLRGWARGDKMWLRRAAMLCQRGLEPAAFDAPLLYDCILPSIGQAAFAGEFFIRKGIGWALRERSYAAPDEVTAFCREYAADLSPLTKREALRVIAKRNPVSSNKE